MKVRAPFLEPISTSLQMNESNPYINGTYFLYAAGNMQEEKNMYIREIIQEDGITFPFPFLLR